MDARAVLLLSALGLFACRSRAEVRAEDAGTAAAESPDATKTVTKADCSAWATHAVTVVVAEMKSVLETCPLPMRDTTSAQLDEDRPTMLAHLASTCEKQLGAQYRAGDGKCVLDAKSAQAITRCKLAALTAPGEVDPATAVAELRKMCAKPAAAASN